MAALAVMVSRPLCFEWNCLDFLLSVCFPKSIKWFSNNAEEKKLYKNLNLNVYIVNRAISK